MYYSSWANQTSFHSAQLHRWVSLKGIQNICSYLLLHWTDTSTTLNNIRCKPAGENKFICPVIALLTWTGSLAATAFRRLFQFSLIIEKWFIRHLWVAPFMPPYPHHFSCFETSELLLSQLFPIFSLFMYIFREARPNQNMERVSSIIILCCILFINTYS